jgi:hypothetical protein
MENQIASDPMFQNVHRSKENMLPCTIHIELVSVCGTKVYAEGRNPPLAALQGT